MRRTRAAAAGPVPDLRAGAPRSRPASFYDVITAEEYRGMTAAAPLPWRARKDRVLDREGRPVAKVPDPVLARAIVKAVNQLWGLR